MTAQLILHFDNGDDLLRVLVFLRENGLNRLAFQPKKGRKIKAAPPPTRSWEGIGLGNFGGALDHVNIRDYAYED